MRLFPVATLTLALLLALSPTAVAEPKKKEPPPAVEVDPFTAATSGLEKHSGLLSFFVDEAAGRVWLEVPATAWDEPLEVLYVEGLVSGLGSNPVGLDRGQLGPTRVVRLRPVGGKLLIEEINLGFRALSERPLEVRAVENSFATSVLWAGEIATRSADGTGLVDLTTFLVRDAHGISATLKRTGQGTFSLDPERSVIRPADSLAFPDNVEFEAILTYGFQASRTSAGSGPGEHVRSTAPTPEAVTVVQHHSFIRLPDDGYRPRRFDPRAGNFAIRFADYAAGLDEPLVKRWIVRHRLEKTDPSAALSSVVEPIVYYVDSGAPEQIQQALIDGASWWAEAFERAGFRDAFRVELLPEGAHPLDVRYNVIQWVHRSTRGWSYGGGITDPRTGEMIKGHVILGSLRVRQDRLIFEGLLGAEKSGSGEAEDPVELALARIRQLSAHEVGHTLGITHNFAASTYGRASVMDYPAPLIRLTESGDFDVSEAYGVGVGAWDIHAVDYAYSQFPPGSDEDTELERILREGREAGWIFITDHDARPPGAAHPLAHLWDNGEEPVAELARLAAVRAAGLDRFGEHSLRIGQPIALLHETIVPLYLMHRFQILAAAKVLGGLDYRYSVRGEDDVEAQLLDPDWQRAALTELLKLVEVEALDLSDEVLDLLLPRPFGYSGNREMFGSRTSPAFDSLGAAATLSQMVMGQILQPERLARIVDHHRRDPAQPSLSEVLEAVRESVFSAPVPEEGRRTEVQRTVQSVTMEHLIDLARSSEVSDPVRSRVEGALRSLSTSLEASAGGSGSAADFAQTLERKLDRFWARQEAPVSPGQPALGPPPGQPIGTGDWFSRDMMGCSWAH